GQEARAPPAEKGLAHDPLARRLGRLALLALRARARSCRPPLPAAGTDSPGMAAHRVARGGTRAHQILALNPAGGYRLPKARRTCQAALAHRARLPGTQAGGRSRPLRGPRLAWLPSPRNHVYRSLRIPDLRAGDDSPLRTSSLHAVRAGCATRRLSTPRIPPAGLSATCQTRSQPSAAA